MTLQDFQVIAIDKGIESVKETYEEQDPRRAGGLDGFEKCRILKTPSDFHDEIKASRVIEGQIRKDDQMMSDSYERQRYTTLQLEYMFELMKVAWNHAKPRLYSFPSLSARAVQQYAKIVGVRGLV